MVFLVFSWSAAWRPMCPITLGFGFERDYPSRMTHLLCKHYVNDVGAILTNKAVRGSELESVVIASDKSITLHNGFLFCRLWRIT